MSHIPFVIGLTGTLCAGKGSAVDCLKKTGFVHFSAREDILIPEVLRRGLEPDRINIGIVANDLRARHGAEYVAFSLYLKTRGLKDNSVIESLYAPAEVEKIEAAVETEGKSFLLIAVDADVRIRYERSQRRKTSTDHVTFEQFVAQEKLEDSSDDPAKHNRKLCMEMADYTIINNGTLKELARQIRQILCTHQEVLDAFPASSV